MKRTLAFLLVACMIVGLVGCGSPDVQSSSADDSSDETTAMESDVKLLYEDEFIKASYVEVFEVEGIDGVFYLRVLVENDSERTIMVTLEDASVNGYSTMVGSGVPMAISPGDKSQQPFIISYANLDIESVEQVENIQFCIGVYDNTDISDILKTEKVTVTV